MTDIRLPKELTEFSFEILANTWKTNGHISLIIPEDLNATDINNIFDFLLKRLPDDFAFFILANMAELENIQIELLERLFDYGDTGCNVSICLRTDLNDKLVKKCRDSKDPAVKEHFSSTGNN